MADNEINKPELPEGFRKRLETRSLLQPITLPVDPGEFQRVWEHIPASQREELIGVLWREGYAFFWNKMKILSRGLQFLSEETRHPDENQVQRADRAANEPEPLVWRSSARSWGDMVLAAFREGSLEATSPLDALERSAKHYLWKDPDEADKPAKPFKPRSVYQNCRNRDDYQDAQKKGPR